MKTYFYMTSASRGVRHIEAYTHFGAYLAIKSWFGSYTTFVIWDENDNIRIFHGEGEQ